MHHTNMAKACFPGQSVEVGLIFHRQYRPHIALCSFNRARVIATIWCTNHPLQAESDDGFGGAAEIGVEEMRAG